MYYYASELTKGIINSASPRVYLYGGYVGYNNFGDIIQLKNTINYHKMTTGLEPIIFFDMSSIDDDEYIDRLRGWFNTDHFIGISNKYMDTAILGLESVETVSAGGVLHLYGGGYLNKHWGAHMLEVISSIIDKYRIDSYVMSGLQIDKETVPLIDKLFVLKKPALMGLRDALSFEIAQTIGHGVRYRFSFDDVTELFDRWSLSKRPGLKLHILKLLRRRTILYHVNLSGYSSTRGVILEKIINVRKVFSADRVKILHAYNDTRPYLVDSLGALIKFNNDFPYSSYSVLNIAQLALEVDMAASEYPDFVSTIGSGRFAICSSYHTAMFMNYFKVPAFLLSPNDFYDQKQKSLGYSGDFNAFIQNPNINLKDFKDERVARLDWIEELTNFFAHVEQDYTAQAQVLGDIDEQIQPLEYRA